VAYANLTGEFDSLGNWLPYDFSGLIIDAGGNIGTSALALADLYPKATIAVIEPSATNFRILQANVASIDRIKPIQKALAERSGEMIELIDPGLGNWGFSTANRPIEGSTVSCIEKVQSTSIPEIREMFPDLPLGLCKLDIEGAEKALFENAPEQFRDIPVICAELHDFFLPGCRAAFHAIAPDRIVTQLGVEKFVSVALARA
jgi:FkbM family methyltransferase